ncbi:DUF2142 domain-containing protein [Streptomyces sp. PanSC9]|uniref:DUF2142 domain-containing protein n=1 Tax=Streptomyces sp. PanSC9 TaxID=1520461 RepID=UPI000F47D19A|nr:hypothetical protein [Streptomyces sp. PanSC9]ROP47205.1 hypothetical protein EDD94_6879 [Streptomyces sp. PanSC9]
MAGSAYAPPTGLRRERPRRPSGHARGPRAVAPLAVVAVVFTLAQLLLVRPGMGLGWDETVYVSQVSAHAPAAFFSAPRARGVSLLVAPVTAWSSSTALLRVYLAVLSGLGLFLALRTWLGLFPVRVLAVAGALFATLWVTLFYGPQAMPNYWVAVGALAAVACFLRARADRTDRPALWGLAACAALMALMRPVDAVWAVLPLLALGLPRHRWRTPWVLLAGLAAGAAEWVAEAYARYGGLGRRLSDGSAIQGGLGWHFAVVDQLRSMGGRALCRPCTGELPNPVVAVWWFTLPVLAVLALAVAVRARRTAATAVPLACAATAAFPYLFLIGYAAPRFLLPAYALLAVPVADLVCRPVSGPRRTWRPLAVTLLCLGLAAHLAVQLAVLRDTVDRTTASHRAWSRTASALHDLGVRPPCLLTGHEAIPVAFYAGCSSAATKGHNANATTAGIVRTAGRVPVAVLVARGTRVPRYARDWPSAPGGEVRLYYAVPGSGAAAGR